MAATSPARSWEILSPSGWAELPTDLKVGCLLCLPARDVLGFRQAGRIDHLTSGREDIWHGLFRRDWSWLFPNVPSSTSGTSTRQHYLTIARKAIPQRGQRSSASSTAKGALGPQFVVFGGALRQAGPHVHVDDAVVSALDLTSEEWRTGPLLNAPGRCAAGFCQDGRGGSVLYSVGGFEFSANEALSSAEAFDTTALLGLKGARADRNMDQDEESFDRGNLLPPELCSSASGVQAIALPKMHIPRACPGAVVVDETLFVVGGGSSMFTAAEAHSSCEGLPHAAAIVAGCRRSLIEEDRAEEFLGGGWRSMPEMQRPRCAAGVCSTDDASVYAISGFGGNGTYEDTVEFLDFSCEEGLRRGWRHAPPLQRARAGCVATYGPDRRIWVLGGGHNDSESSASVEVLDPRLGRWSTNVLIPDMPSRRRCFAGGFCSDGHLYVYGGWDSSQWHDPSATRLDIRTLRWEELPSHAGDIGAVIPYHFVSGCLAI